LLPQYKQTYSLNVAPAVDNKIQLRPLDETRQALLRSSVGGLFAPYDVAELFDTSLERVRLWRRDGDGPPHILIAGKPYYRPQDVITWIESLPVGQQVPKQRKTRKKA
jgi:hypothetical protein